MSDQAKDTPDQAEFRAYCKEWLASNHPGQPPVHIPQGALELSDPDALAWLQRWQKSAYDAGLVGADYPVESGGGGRTGARLGAPRAGLVLRDGRICGACFGEALRLRQRDVLPEAPQRLGVVRAV